MPQSRTPCPVLPRLEPLLLMEAMTACQTCIAERFLTLGLIQALGHHIITQVLLGLVQGDRDWSAASRLFRRERVDLAVANGSPALLARRISPAPRSPTHRYSPHPALTRRPIRSHLPDWGQTQVKTTSRSLVVFRLLVCGDAPALVGPVLQRPARLNPRIWVLVPFAMTIFPGMGAVFPNCHRAQIVSSVVSPVTAGHSNETRCTLAHIDNSRVSQF